MSVSADDDGGGAEGFVWVGVRRRCVIAGEEEWTGTYEGKVSKWARYFRDLKGVSCTLRLYHTKTNSIRDISTPETGTLILVDNRTPNAEVERELRFCFANFGRR